MGARFCFFFAWFLGFLPGVTFSSFPAFLAWARGACVFLVANFLQIVFWLGFLPGVGAPGARQSFVFFGGFQGVFSDFSKLAHVLAHFCFFCFLFWVVRLGCIAWGQQFLFFWFFALGSAPGVHCLGSAIT